MIVSVFQLLDLVSVRQRLRWLNARGPEMAELLGPACSTGFHGCETGDEPLQASGGRSKYTRLHRCSCTVLSVLPKLRKASWLLVPAVLSRRLLAVVLLFRKGNGKPPGYSCQRSTLSLLPISVLYHLAGKPPGYSCQRSSLSLPLPISLAFLPVSHPICSRRRRAKRTASFCMQSDWLLCAVIRNG